MSAQGNGNNSGGCRKCNETQKRLDAIEKMLVELRETDRDLLFRIEWLSTPQPEKVTVTTSTPDPTMGVEVYSFSTTRK